MSVYFEIAFAAVSNRLCLFTGTGFSKSVSDNKAPSWKELLQSVCDELPNSAALKASLLPVSGPGPLTLEEAAQVISLELSKEKKDIHDIIAQKIQAISLEGDNSAIQKFLQSNIVKAVTTNYDNLLQQLAPPGGAQSIIPGKPVPRAQANLRVYHVHGSIESPHNMVVTSNDYFKFLSGESYFSRKLSTLLHENCVVILGYSLSDTNLKLILNTHRAFALDHNVGSNIFFIFRRTVDQYIKDYYAYCYGIRVIDNTEVAAFFAEIEKNLQPAKDCIDNARQGLSMVLNQKHHYTDQYLKQEPSFFQIISALAAGGHSIGEARVVAMLSKIIERKTALTREHGAWEQYDHLARWLIHLASTLVLKGTTIEQIFLAAAFRSMTTMSKTKIKGLSWQAFNAWNSGWSDVHSENRTLIRDYIKSKTTDSNALEIVDRL